MPCLQPQVPQKNRRQDTCNACAPAHQRATSMHSCQEVMPGFQLLLFKQALLIAGMSAMNHGSPVQDACFGQNSAAMHHAYPSEVGWCSAAKVSCLCVKDGEHAARDFHCQRSRIMSSVKSPCKHTMKHCYWWGRWRV